MKPEEKRIWDAHQGRLVQISREKNTLWKKHNEKKEAIEASFGKEEVPEEKLKTLASEADQISYYITAKEKAELSRYMSEIEAYDKQREKGAQAKGGKSKDDFDRS